MAQDDRELDRSAPGAGAPGAATTGAAATAEGEGAATRSQHVVLTLPYDWGLIPQFLRGPLERLDRQGTTAAPGPQLLVVTPDAETAIAVADAALVGRAGEAPFVLPVTRPERAARQLAARPAAAVAGTPAALAALVRGASLKLGGLRTLVLAWADETLAQPGAAAELEVLLAEVPRDVARLLVAAAMTDDVAALVERTMFRARRVDAQPRAGAEPVAVSYVAAAPAARADALRRVLDELDPVTAAVVVGTDAGEAEARRALRALGYAGDGAAAGALGASAVALGAPPAGDAPSADAAGSVAAADDADADDDDAFDDEFHGDFADAAGAPESALQRALTAGAEAAGGAGAAGGPAPSAVAVVRAGAVPPHTAVAVLYELPAAREALDQVAAARPGQIVALVQPRQLEALRALAGGPARALPLGEAARRARARDEALRAELRAELERGLPPRELAVLEPLLAEHDAAEVAAAALRLVDRERARRASAAAAPNAAAGAAQGAGAPAAPAFPPSGMTRLFLTVGSRDNVRPGDLVGAITGEAGISSDKLGKIDVRESFSLVEVQSAEAERVVAKVNGIAIRGRRVAARPERDAGGERAGGPGGGRGGDRGGERGGRPPRAGGPDRGDRGDRPRGPGRPAFGDRPARGGFGPPGGERRGPERRTFDTRDGPRTFGGPDDRSVGERTEQRGEWAERAERLRRARRGAPGEGDGGPGGGPGDGGAADITES